MNDVASPFAVTQEKVRVRDRCFSRTVFIIGPVVRGCTHKECERPEIRLDQCTLLRAISACQPFAVESRYVGNIWPLEWSTSQ